MHLKLISCFSNKTRQQNKTFFSVTFMKMVNLNVFKGAEDGNDNENASLALVFLLLKFFRIAL